MDPQTFSAVGPLSLPLGLERDSLPHLLHVQHPPPNIHTYHLHGAGFPKCSCPTGSKDLPPGSVGHSRLTQPDLHLGLPFKIQKRAKSTWTTKGLQRVQPYQGSSQNPVHVTCTTNTHSHKLPVTCPVTGIPTPFTGAALPTFHLILKIVTSF